MLKRRFASLTWRALFVAVFLVFVSTIVFFNASQIEIPDGGRADFLSQVIQPDEVKPSACIGVTIYYILIGSTVTGTASNDLIIGTSGNDTLDGGLGNDCILGNGGTDTIDGGGGDGDICIADPGSTLSNCEE